MFWFTYFSDVDCTERYKTTLYLHPAIQSTGQGISVDMLIFKILFTVVPFIIQIIIKGSFYYLKAKKCDLKGLDCAF